MVLALKSILTKSLLLFQCCSFSALKMYIQLMTQKYCTHRQGQIQGMSSQSDRLTFFFLHKTYHENQYCVVTKLHASKISEWKMEAMTQKTITANHETSVKQSSGEMCLIIRFY